MFFKSYIVLLKILGDSKISVNQLLLASNE